jgi:hypothetical protein
MEKSVTRQSHAGVVWKLWNSFRMPLQLSHQLRLILGSQVIDSFVCTPFHKQFWEELIAYFPWYDTGHIDNHAYNNYSFVACVFVTMVTFLPSRCLATITGFLPSRCLATIGGYTYRHTDWWEGFLIRGGLRCQAQGSGAMMCVPSFIKITLGIHKLIGGDTHTHTDSNMIS